MVALAFVATFLAAFSSNNHHPYHSNMAPQQRKKLKLSSSSSSSDAGSVLTSLTRKTLRPFPVEQHAVQLSPDEAAAQLQQLTKDMNARAGQPFTDAELDGVVHSLQNVLPANDDDDSDHCSIQWDDLRTLLRAAAHLSHKDWSVTQANAAKLAAILLPSMDRARPMLERILREGNWDGAAAHAAADKRQHEPWAVLVTGVK